MVVAAIDDGDLELLRAAQAPRALQAGEARADDDETLQESPSIEGSASDTVQP
jgi:hypothetical protein